MGGLLASNESIENFSYEGLSIGFDCYRLVFFDGKFSVRLSDWIREAKITSLDAMGGLDKAEQPDSEPLPEAVLPKALTQSDCDTGGVYIEIKPGSALSKPIYLFHLNTGGEEQDAYYYRHHIELGKNSSCEIIEHHVSLNQIESVSHSRLTANVGDNAHLYHSKIIQEGVGQQHVGHNDILVQRDATATSTVVIFDGEKINHQTSSCLCQPNGYLEMNSLALPRQEQVFNSCTYLKHKADHCPSKQTHKVIASDKSSAVFDGMIYVEPEALKTDGQMDNHNLILGNQAQVNSNPQLEIYADDVKCSHGATTGQLDKDQIGYLRARGIKKAKAKQMITFAFAAEVAQTIRNESIRDYIQKRIRLILEEVAR
ncbi:Fe-S cluster assembly protein SufD [Vibrio sp. JC009]|uniref:Fe-S cluster assembly protein SufD n=1 Tax=Vibrio sp. JC009 TaxID=2912314 RepID=UPI0023AFB1E5|nr:Fe-S cluster assembly protein SufD [Vibrio sp. JC009]WED23971.1 Fe-S cluster assembly protein SufD [Vibrio sp. JC009]